MSAGLLLLQLILALAINTTVLHDEVSSDVVNIKACTDTTSNAGTSKLCVIEACNDATFNILISCTHSVEMSSTSHNVEISPVCNV